jgi:F-type H+-transporting ATPase subunit b
MNINFTLFAQAIVFTAFIWFTIKFVWPPLLRAIETRQKQIADGLAAAEQGKKSLEVSARQAEQAIQEAQRARAQLREQGAALAVAGAEKILRREVDAKAHAELLDGIKKQL